MTSPRVILGVPVYNRAGELRESIESFLGQTFTQFALVVVDDGSSDETVQIAREYEAMDGRVSVHTNAQRLGMIDNWRRAFELAHERYPDAEYFAWGSDHDLWHPRWLQQLVRALDENPDVVLAYPLNRRISAVGELLSRKPWEFDTAGVRSRSRRFGLTIRKMSAGNMIYGASRVSALKKAGVFRHVMVPDRLLLTELSLYGQFKQVPEVLWFRRWYGRLFSLGRQRASFFPGRRPRYAYFPWWMSHAATLFWLLTIRGERQPEIDRATGALLAIRLFVMGGLLHFWQSLRELRYNILERVIALRPYERKLRLLFRSISRRGGVDWTVTLMKETFGRKVRRKTWARMKKRVRTFGNELVRRPGVVALKAVRAIPIVRNRAIPWLLRAELDQIPSAPIAGELKRELERLAQSQSTLIVGPWVSEVGFELLYWIPFLNWATRAYGIKPARLIAVSRGGAKPWYQHLTGQYVDIFDLYSVQEYRDRNQERWSDGGNQKQYEITDLDREIVERVKIKLRLDNVELLHPMLMYRLLRFFWYEKAAVSLLLKHTEYRRLNPVDGGGVIAELPRDFVAVRFYFRPSFPDTPENRMFAANLIRSLSREIPVVLLNTGLTLDDHEDLNVPGGLGVHRIDRFMTPEQNLEVQTQVISRARAFVGTYGGLAYVGPFYGVPSVGFYSNESELVPAHLDVGWRLGRLVGHPALTLDTHSAGVLRMLFEGSGAETLPRTMVAR